MTDAAGDLAFPLRGLRPAATFFGAPVADVEDLAPETIAAAGVYCDHFSAGQPGGRFGARQFRYVSTVSDLPVPTGLVDLGDFNVFPLEPQRTCEILSNQSQRIAATGAALFAFGGDFSVTPALLRGIVRAIGPLAVLRISSRLDLQSAAAGTAGAPWRRSATRELAEILPNQLSAIALLGARGTLPAEEQAAASEAVVVPATELAAAPEHAVRKTCDALQRVAARFYLSVDVDVLAPRFGARALPTAAGGLSVVQLLDVLAALDGMPFVGAELTGHVPDLGVAGRAMTSQLACVAAKMLDCLAEQAQQCP